MGLASLTRIERVGLIVIGVAEPPLAVSRSSGQPGAATLSPGNTQS